MTYPHRQFVAERPFWRHLYASFLVGCYFMILKFLLRSAWMFLNLKYFLSLRLSSESCLEKKISSSQSSEERTERNGCLNRKDHHDHMCSSPFHYPSEYWCLWCPSVTYFSKWLAPVYDVSRAKLGNPTYRWVDPAFWLFKNFQFNSNI